MLQNSQSPIPQRCFSVVWLGSWTSPMPAVLHQSWVHPTRGPTIHTELDVIYPAPQKCYRIPRSVTAHDADLTEATNYLFLHSNNTFIWALRLCLWHSLDYASCSTFLSSSFLLLVGRHLQCFLLPCSLPQAVFLPQSPPDSSSAPFIATCRPWLHRCALTKLSTGQRYFHNLEGYQCSNVLF